MVHILPVKKMDSYSLYTQGYIVLKNQVNIPDWKKIEPDIVKLNKKMHRIFQYGKKTRYQAFISKKETILYQLVSETALVLQRLMPHHQMNGAVLLANDANCEVQPAHSDYPPWKQTKANLLNEQKACGCLIAIMPGSSLTIWKGLFNNNIASLSDFIFPSVISLDVGDLLVFTSDLIHAGSAYEQENYRIHLYLDTVVQRHTSNRTWRVDKNGPADHKVIELLSNHPHNNKNYFVQVIKVDSCFYEWDSLTLEEKEKWKSNEMYYVTENICPLQGSAFPYEAPFTKTKRTSFSNATKCLWYKKRLYCFDLQSSYVKENPMNTKPGITLFWVQEKDDNGNHWSEELQQPVQYSQIDC